MKRQSEKQQQPKTQMHFHYHYYNPNWTTQVPKEKFREKPSLSQKVTPAKIKNLTQAQIQIQIQEHHQMYNVYDQSNTEQRQKTSSKNYLNDLLKNGSKNRLIFSRTTEPISSQGQHEKTSQKSSKLTRSYINQNKKMVDQSIQTKCSERQSSVIDRYQQELKWYINEVKRLKNIEEQCIYLRAKFIEHSQKCES